MPNKDKTGPEGKGPKTGRHMGDCEGAESRPRFGQRLGRRLFGRNGGKGRRFN